VVTDLKRSDVLRPRSSQPLHDFFGYSHSYNIHPIFDSLSLYDNFNVPLVFSIFNAVGLTSQTGQTGAAQRSSCSSTGAKVGIRVGVVIVAIAVLAGGTLLLWRR
jgi:hypothetical protein